MILGLDHIALNTIDLSSTEKELINLGYSSRFCELDLLNDTNKIPFLWHYEKRHHINLLHAVGCTPIEITVHHTHTANSSELIHISMLASPNNCKRNDSEIDEYLEKYFGDEYLGFFNTSIIPTPIIGLSSNSKHSSFLAYEVENLAAGIAFWDQFLGARLTLSDNANFAVLTVNSPVKSWSLGCLLFKGRKRSIPMLDDAGLTCTAILCTNLDSHLTEYTKIFESDCIMPFTVNINNKAIRLALLRGPHAEIYELIEIER
ncbi:MAG: hypothetical protein VX619_06975 [bacterium]|nr:hypothetical protein [bacterium]